MTRRTIAPMLRRAHPRPLSPREIMRGARQEIVTYRADEAHRELAALLEVAAAARSVRLWSKPADMDRSDFLGPAHADLNTRTPADRRLHLALARLDSVSTRRTGRSQ